MKHGPGGAFCPHCGREAFVSNGDCPDCGADLGPGQREGPPEPAPLLGGEEDGFRASAGIEDELRRSTRGRYEILSRLGSGGMGLVFEAHDSALDIRVAIKVMSPALLTNADMVRRFEREARTVAALRHPSIVRVHDVGKAGDLHYFVMDHVPGAPLSRILRVHGRLSIAMVCSILRQLASALSHAHHPQRRVVHRDVKPSNTILDPDGKAVLVDFGVAKIAAVTSRMTRAGTVLGSPEYMSPEQCRGERVTKKSDQYSLGTVSYAMLTGGPPFTGPVLQVLSAHQQDSPTPLLRIRPDCTPELAAIVERMLAKNPSDRWPELDDVLAELDTLALEVGRPGPEEIRSLMAPEPVRARPERMPASADGGVTSPDFRPARPTQADERSGALEARLVLRAAAASLAARARRPAFVSLMLMLPVAVLLWGPWRPGSSVDTGTRSPVVASSDEGPIGPEGLELLPDQSLELEVSLSAADGGSSSRALEWASDDERVAHVENGVVTARAPGSTVVRVLAPGVEVAFPVAVRSLSRGGNVLVSVVGSGPIPDSGLQLEAGARRELQVVVTDSDGGVLNRTVEIQSTDPGIAALDGRVLTASGIGAALVRVSAGDLERTFPVTVLDRDPGSGSVELTIAREDGGPIGPRGLAMGVGERVSLRVEAAGPDAPAVGGPAQWQSTAASIVSVDGGLVLARRPGTATLRARVNGLTGAVGVTVTGPRRSAPVDARISVIPRGALYIDGELIDSDASGTVDRELTPGPHVIRLENSELGRVLIRELDLLPGTIVSLELDLLASN